METVAGKKKLILESMLVLVQEHGFHGTPMSMVARHAGVAAGTIYHYFRSKDDLMYALFDYVQQQVIAVVEREDCQDIPYKECFFNIWAGLYTFYSGKPAILRFFEQFVNSPYLAAMPALEQDKFYRLFFSFFERGIAGGHLKAISPRILGTLAHSTIISTAKLTSSGRLVLEQHELEQIPQVLWDGLRRE